jgi:hypothetical protein
MIRSQARQRTTPWIAGIGPSSTKRAIHVDDVPSTALSVLRDRKHDLVVVRTVTRPNDEEDLNIETLFDVRQSCRIRLTPSGIVTHSIPPSWSSAAARTS